MCLIGSVEECNCGCPTSSGTVFAGCEDAGRRIAVLWSGGQHVSKLQTAAVWLVGYTKSGDLLLFLVGMPS